MENFILAVDIGNTHTKCSLLTENGEFLCHFKYDDMRVIIQQYSLNRENTIAGVVSVKEGQLNLPFEVFNVADFFKDNSFLDMPVSYGETLGHDRLVLAYYCYKMDNNPKIVIDTGTFTTLDSVDMKGFNGGYILPGLGSILKSYESGDQLFSVENLANIVDLKDLLNVYPKTTKDAIAHDLLAFFWILKFIFNKIKAF